MAQRDKHLDYDELQKAFEAAQSEVAQLKNAIEEASRRYANLFEYVGDSIFIVDSTTHTIVEANRNAARRLGYSHDDLIGMSLEDIEVLEENQGVELLAWESAYSGTQVYECHYRHKDNYLIPVEVSSRVISIDKRGYIQNFVRNISVRKRIDAERQELITDLDSFAHTVAHDLKNPISVILGYVRLLEDGWSDLVTEEIQELLHFISSNSLRAINIIDELLLLASVRKQDEIERSSLDMARIVARAIERLRPMIDEHQAEIILPTEWPTAVGYAPWIEEIWINYIGNAVKYGGDPPVIELGGTIASNRMARFWVRDNGPGIEPDQLDSLFIMFNRLSNVRAEGHGLGLSIVKRIAEKLNGQVDVESVIGEGSTFSFILPGAK